MKTQDTAFKTTKLSQKSTFVSGSNFKEKIPNYINQINLSTSLFYHPTQLITAPSKNTTNINFDTRLNRLKSQISTILETQTKLYLFLARKTQDECSQIILYEYLKINGEQKSMELDGLNGEVSVMRAKFCERKRKILQNFQAITSTKKSSSVKKNNISQYEIVLLIGTVQGYLKTLRFSYNISEEEIKIESTKLDYTQIVSIAVLQPQFYSGANLCLGLSLTNKVYLVNFDSMSVIAIFTPTIMSCEVGLGLSINQQRQYFIQTCESGYIVFWDINEHIIELIKKSAAYGEKKGQEQDKEYQFINSKDNKYQFDPFNLYHSICPLSIFHSATIDGLKYCELYGNLLLLITQGGILKLIAVNNSSNSPVNQNQYCLLIEYQIEDGHLVSDVRFFPSTLEVFVVKSEAYSGTNIRNGTEGFLPIRQYDVDKHNQKKKNNKSQSLKPYIPKIMKSIHKNYVADEKSNKSRPQRCYFERIVVNCQLQIEKVDKIFPSKSIENIESLEMTENRDIIVLRGREFYLIGDTNIFDIIDGD